MLSQLGCAEEDAEVDVELGYPRVYAKLCRHEDAAGLPIPFTEGPPQRFLPYAPHAEDFQHLKDWDSLFPVVAEKEKDSSNARRFAEELWQQLDHLGNAGFDPSKFRVDPYGNVVYWNADPSSPLAWDVDHWFPSSRGGLTKLPNLRIVQWQAFLRKRNRLEFLVPWWDLQHGCSVNQFLSAFAAKNTDFRKRSFALFFAGGEDESVAREHVGECRPWPPQFREKKALCGLAAAAIVSVTTPVGNEQVQASRGSLKGTQPKRHWSAEEEEAVKRGVGKFGPGSWNEIKADESSALANRSALQIKEKFRLMRGVSRNNGASSTSTARTDLVGRQSAATTALQKELRVKIMREEERREREEELTQLEETVAKLKLENEKERMKAVDLESLLRKRKHRLEKHRKVAESQSSFRLCLERVLRDTMHQAMAYKEQAQLTQEACNVLVARLDCQKALCEAVEGELLQCHSTRETLESAATVPSGGNPAMAHQSKQKDVTRGRDLVDVSSCVSLRAMDGEHHNEGEDNNNNKSVVSELSESEEEAGEGDGDDDHSLRRRASARKSLVRHAIKVAMQVEDTKEAVDMAPWMMAPKSNAKPMPITAEYKTEPRTRRKTSEAIVSSLAHHHYDCDSETSENSSDSDFADDEMSPAMHITRDPAHTCKASGTSNRASNKGDVDSQLVSELSKFHDGPTSDLRDFCARNSKPSDRDFARDFAASQSQPPAAAALEPAAQTVGTPPGGAPGSAGDTSRSDSKREVQKDVIVVQSESVDSTAAMYKQAYLDELLQQIRFQIPTPEVKAGAIQGHVDELLERVLSTHLENMRRTGTDGSRKQQQQQNPGHDSVDDEKVKQLGKSNLDKWLQALLLKGIESASSSPGRTSPRLQLLSPALSQISVAAMRESLERARHQELMSTRRDGETIIPERTERPKSLRGALLRKLSVQNGQPVEHRHESDLFEPLKENYDVACCDTAPALSAGESKQSNNGGAPSPCTALPGWPGSIGGQFLQ